MASGLGFDCEASESGKLPIFSSGYALLLGQLRRIIQPWFFQAGKEGRMGKNCKAHLGPGWYGSVD